MSNSAYHPSSKTLGHVAITLMQGQCEMGEIQLEKDFHDNGFDKHATLMQCVSVFEGSSVRPARHLK